LSVELDPRQFVGLDFQSAAQLAHDEAERIAESQIFDAVEENLPEGEEEEDWNWEALAKLANTRWKTNFRDKDLKKAGRDEMVQLLIDKAREAIAKVDLSEGTKFLVDDFGVHSACSWLQYKFGFTLDPQEARALDLETFKDLIHQRAVAAYEEKETEYPVMAGLYHFTTQDAGGQKRFDREQLVAWARERFQVDLDLEDLKNKQRDEIRLLLIEKSRANQHRAGEALAELRRRVNELPQDADEGSGPRVGANGALGSLADWLRETVGYQAPLAELAEWDREELKNRLSMVVEDHFRPEMRRMERALVLEILDTSWKDHLLAMDHLRSAVGLRSWAQVDPKVEYKREGMKTFEQMWTSIDERVTDLIFRMEQLNENFVGSMWKESAAIHEDAQSTTEIARQQMAAIDATEGTQKIEPIRNRAPKVGRNEPCPCGSGKKYKNCHLRKGGIKETI
jgi:preprotein translocase subunit SecA